MSHDCPDDSTLAALFEGLLPPAERDALYGEMSRCPDCQTALAMIGMGLADEASMGLDAVQVPAGLEARVRALYTAPQPGLAERVVGIAVRRVRGVLESLAEALAPAPMPALAVRGAGEAEGLRFEVDVGVPVELMLSGASEAATRVVVRPLGAPPPRSRLVLSRDAHIAASLALDEGGVHLPELAAGRYELRFEIPGRADTVLPIELEDGRPESA